MAKIEESPEKYLIVHYSSQSFYDIPEGGTSRITSIAVRFVRSGQAKSFSVHKVAEIEGKTSASFKSDYAKFEKKMLAEFFEFMQEHQSMTWIHWNMRDINFGFQALEHRFQVLKGSPIIIKDENKLDLSRALLQLFGSSYIEHPRLENLIDLNRISRQNFLTGKEEARAYEEEQFVKLHQSTLRKVDIFHSIINKVNDGTPRHRPSIWQLYGISPQGVHELIKNNWLMALIAFAAVSALSLLVSLLLQ